MTEMVSRLRAALLEALAADSAYVSDLDAEGRAVAAESGEAYTGSQGVIVDGVIDPERVVRAVLAAMREPTEKMCAAPHHEDDGCDAQYQDDEAFAGAWGAMIDAALA